jgi:TPR repeat protein
VEKAARDERLLALELAAEQGDAGSQYNLDCKYARGEDVVKDEAKAVRLFGQAAKQNLADAQSYLGY